jgi:hypothetical protein
LGGSTATKNSVLSLPTGASACVWSEDYNTKKKTTTVVPQERLAAATAWSMKDSVYRPSCPLKEKNAVDDLLARAWWIELLVFKSMEVLPDCSFEWNDPPCVALPLPFWFLCQQTESKRPAPPSDQRMVG